MTTTVAIINWNSGPWLRPCIESLLVSSVKAEILVIDNASEDSSLESVEGFGNRVSVIRNNVNRGFAAAVNQAFHATSTSYVLILNPDLRATAPAVQLLQEFMDAHPRAGAVGGYVGDKYLPRPFPTVPSLIFENLGIRWRTGRAEQPAAAALMIRRDAHKDIGGFDEQFYPAWYEDVDFCQRLKAKGWEIHFLPKAEFLHEGGYSAEAMGTRDFLRAYYGNQARYARKHFGRLGTAVVRASAAAGMIGRMIWKWARSARATARSLS
jgi:GT2 family glycosyltransferase